MTREERNKVLAETKECTKTITELAINSMVDAKLEDEENQLIDCLEFQTQQFDRIEDQIDSLCEMIKKGEKKKEA